MRQRRGKTIAKFHYGVKVLRAVLSSPFVLSFSGIFLPFLSCNSHSTCHTFFILLLLTYYELLNLLKYFFFYFFARGKIFQKHLRKTYSSSPLRPTFFRVTIFYLCRHYEINGSLDNVLFIFKKIFIR